MFYHIFILFRSTHSILTWQLFSFQVFNSSELMMEINYHSRKKLLFIAHTTLTRRACNQGISVAKSVDNVNFNAAQRLRVRKGSENILMISLILLKKGVKS